MRALCSNSVQPNLKHSKGAKERLFVPRHEILDALRGGGIRRIVDVFWRFEFVPDLSEIRGQIGAAYGLAEGRAITEQQALELVHHNERYKSALIKLSSHMIGQVAQ